MSIVTESKGLTAAAFFLLPQPNDGSRQELVRGEVVIMPPPGGRHGVVCLNVSILLGGFVKRHKLGSATSNDTGVILERDRDTVRGPDFAYWSAARLPEMPVGYPDVPPDLAVEVLSPSDSLARIEEKIEQYLRAGVQQVWVLDPEDRTVRIHRSGDESSTYRDADELAGGDVLPGFHCVVSELFE